ncbi:MAG: FAD-dependent monooxygenase, partial [Myxococcales bacterium]|nr:FAD-dependent monooxygenase [Myxococcales bacterium]
MRVDLPHSLPSLPDGVRAYVADALDPLPLPRSGLENERVVIVGAGPCGLFAALGLAERGIKTIILDRGQAVKPRAKDVSRLMGKGQLDPDSNL